MLYEVLSNFFNWTTKYGMQKAKIGGIFILELDKTLVLYHKFCIKYFTHNKVVFLFN